MEDITQTTENIKSLYKEYRDNRNFALIQQEMDKVINWIQENYIPELKSKVVGLVGKKAHSSGTEYLNQFEKIAHLYRIAAKSLAYEAIIIYLTDADAPNQETRVNYKKLQDTYNTINELE